MRKEKKGDNQVIDKENAQQEDENKEDVCASNKEIDGTNCNQYSAKG